MNGAANLLFNQAGRAGRGVPESATGCAVPGYNASRIEAQTS